MFEGRVSVPAEKLGALLTAPVKTTDTLVPGVEVENTAAKAVTVPMHVPFTAKQPVRMLMPEPNVEVAVAEMLMVLAPVLPSESNVPGEVVPMPMLPLALIVNRVVTSLAMVPE